MKKISLKNSNSEKIIESLDSEMKRRDFINLVIKTAIPTIAFLSLGNIGSLFAQSETRNIRKEKLYKEKTDCPDDCTKSCKGTCEDTCRGVCKDNCENTCNDVCQDSCNNTCKGTCEGFCGETCKGGCQGSCENTCKGTCDNTCKDTCDTTCTGSVK